MYVSIRPSSIIVNQKVMDKRFEVSVYTRKKETCSFEPGFLYQIEKCVTNESFFFCFEIFENTTTINSKTIKLARIG